MANGKRAGYLLTSLILVTMVTAVKAEDRSVEQVKKLVAPLHWERSSSAMVKGRETPVTLTLEFQGTDPNSFSMQFGWYLSAKGDDGKVRQAGSGEGSVNLKATLQGERLILRAVDDLNKELGDLTVEIDWSKELTRCKFSKALPMPGLTSQPVDFSGEWKGVGSKPVR